MKKLNFSLTVLLFTAITPLSFVFALPADIAPAGDGLGSSSCVDLFYNMSYRATDSKTGGEVSLLQSFLNDKSYLQQDPTGFFGVATLNAVKKFQKDSGFSPTGYVGPLTRARIKSITCGRGEGQGGAYPATSSSSGSNSIGGSSSSVPAPVPSQGMSSQPGDTNTSLSVTTLSSYNDRAGIWNNFSPGTGNVNKTADDWNWQATLTLQSQKSIKSMTLAHNTPGEVWSTSYSADNKWQKTGYPLVVDYNGSQIDYGYDTSFLVSTFPAGSSVLKLYGQKESAVFTGGVLIIKFDDGTSVSASVPAQTTTVLTKPLVCGNLGDVNGDGVISQADIDALRQVVLNNSPVADGRQDVNGDGKVTTLDIAYITGYLNGTQTTFPGCANSSAQPTITVLSPNGGEIFVIGNNYQIKWQSSGSGADQNVEIDLERKTATDSQFWNVGTIATGQPGTGTYQWHVAANDIAGAQYKILIGRNLASGLGPVAESNSFTIAAPTRTQHSISYVQAYAEDKNVIHAGEQSIIYGSGLASAQYVMINGQSVPALHSYDTSMSFIAPTTLQNGTASIYVGDQTLWTSNSITVQTVGSTIALGTSTASSITVTSPNGGESYTSGQSVTATWNSTGGDTVALYLSYPDGGVCYIGTTGSDAGRYSFNPTNYKCPNIPMTISSGQYKVNLYLHKNGESDAYAGTGVAQDKSDNYFTITTATPPTPSTTAPTLTVLTPTNSAGVATFKPGEIMTIQWASTGLIGAKNIQLVPISGGSNISVVSLTAADMPLSGSSYSWTVPTTAPSGQYRVQVTIGAGALVAASAGAVSVSNPALPITTSNVSPQSTTAVSAKSLTVLTPINPTSASSYFKQGDQLPIKWSSTGVRGVTLIKLVPSSGTAVGSQTVLDLSSVYSFPLTTDSYSWTIPTTVPVGRYKVSVQIGRDDGALIGVSDGEVLIGAAVTTQPAPTATTPSTASTDSTASTATSSASSTGQSVAGATVSDSLSVLSAKVSSDDRAGGYNVFGPGSYNGVSADWNWTLAFQPGKGRVAPVSIKTITVTSPKGEVWTTRTTSNYWPVVVYSNGGQLNKNYDGPLGSYQPGRVYKLDLYGQIYLTTFTGGTVTMVLGDGSILNAPIPSISGQPVIQFQSQ
jgi:hypothetical protein